VIDLLPDHEGSTLEGWLKSHPEVELITRDRALAYADGATKGAPQAVQVVDRFHLIKNLVESFENLARRHSSALRESALEVGPRRQTEMMLLAEGLLEALPERMPKKSPTPSQRRDQNRAERMARQDLAGCRLQIERPDGSRLTLTLPSLDLASLRQICADFFRA
jgi:transposase